MPLISSLTVIASFEFDAAKSIKSSYFILGILIDDGSSKFRIFGQ